MKTVTISPRPKTVTTLLQRAKRGGLILRSPDGDEFILVDIDDFDREIQLQRQNKEFMRFLDERGREKATITAEEARRSLGLPPANRRRRSA